MVSKRVIIAVVLVISLLFVVGCSGIIGTKKPKDQGPEGTFRTGMQGLVLKLVPGSPPPEVYEGDRMDVSVEYVNKGAFDITGGYLYIGGYDKNYLRFDKNMYSGVNAKGKDEFNPEGNIVNTVTYSIGAVNLPDNADIFPQTIKATACYKYRTYAIGKTCIDPDPYGIGYGEKVCTVSAPQVGSSQGAPVAVSSVEAQTSRNRVQFKVNIANVGGGAVIDNAAPISDCDIKLDRTQIDKVDIRAKFSTTDMRCEPSTVRLTNNNGFAICHWEGDIGTEAYETSLDIQLDYGYRSSISADVRIHRLPGKYTYG